LSLIVRGEGDDDHWTWTGETRVGGTPWFHLTAQEHGSAAKIAWDLWSDTPLGIGAIHRVCDEPLCIRPEHHRPGYPEKEPSARTRASRARARRITKGAPVVAELLRLQRRNDEQDHAHVTAVSRIAERIDALSRMDEEHRTTLFARLDAIEHELQKLGMALSVRVEAVPSVAPAGKPVSLAASFEMAMGLRPRSVLDESPLRDALAIAVESAHDVTKDGAALFASWLGRYREAEKQTLSTPTAERFLGFVRDLPRST
jgi:hypothetical protein